MAGLPGGSIKLSRVRSNSGKEVQNLLEKRSIR